MKWNPYNVKVTDEWVKDFASRHNIKNLKSAKRSLRMGLFIENVKCLVIR